MANPDRIRRQQILREAEGYLDLITVLSDKLPLRPSVRDRLAQRVLSTLDRLDEAWLHRAPVLHLRGQALRCMERYPQAVQVLEEAAEAEPENIHIWLALGWCYKRCDRLDLAIEALEEALAVDPNEAIVYYNLACYWSLAKNAKLAIEYLGRSFDIDPNYRDLVAAERDFDPIRQDPLFQALTSVIV